MFHSFFPRPKVFFLSAFAFFLVALGIWYSGADGLASKFALFGADLSELPEGERPPFFTIEKVWVYQFIIATSVLFCVVWAFIERHRWFLWSVLGSTFILVFTYFMVQFSVWINDWYGEFFDLIQRALTEPGTVSSEEYYEPIKEVLIAAMVIIMARVLFSYFNQHYVFRWRTAMNEYYTQHWPKLRKVEGAAQRVQEDTMRFAGIVEGLGSAFVSSIMTLIAFLPLLWNLSKQVTELPIIGAVNGSLVLVALLSAMFGTVLLAAVGYRLPGLEFHNQRVEAAYRKELVYGEDDPNKAQPEAVASLFGGVRKNYFKLYFNYLYFNVFRYAYLQLSALITLIVLGPTVIAGAITFGVFQQIRNAFSQVENSFQFLVNSWTTIIELISIYKRLQAFESILDEDDNVLDDVLAT